MCRFVKGEEGGEDGQVVFVVVDSEADNADENRG